MAKNLYDATASELAELISQRKVSVLDVVNSCLDKIAETDSSIHAWTTICAEQARKTASMFDTTGATATLAGIPIGIKDNINTKGVVTTYGSPIYSEHRPDHDATIVSLCKHAGTIPLGKTASTEFAYRTAGPCKNPNDLQHSPGGSSSGSAAAVAARMVPLALGTQTGGSVIRPASYCGVYGLKPRYGDFGFAGVKNLAHSFDTLGFMARSLQDLSLFYCSLHNMPVHALSGHQVGAPKIGIYRTAFWDEAQPAAKDAFETMLKVLSKSGANLHEVRLDELDRRMLTSSWVINKYEGSRHLLHDWLFNREKLSGPAQDLVQEGMKIDHKDYEQAQRVFVQARSLMSRIFNEFDAIVSLSSPGEAPEGISDTGPVTFNFIWTASYLPALNLPFFKGPKGLPIGMQIIGPKSHQHLFDASHWIEQQLRRHTL